MSEENLPEAMTPEKGEEYKNLPGVATVVIKPLDMRYVTFGITGTTPLVINKFSSRIKIAIRETQEAGRKASSKRVRDPKDFDGQFNDARRVSTDGWDGIHAAAFRNAMISACKVAGFVMTRAKLGIFIEAEGFDKDDRAPLVRIQEAEPQYLESAVRNANGNMDLRARPMYENWKASLTVRYDGDVFSMHDIANLLVRVGAQVGICEGRPDSKSSAGCGWGLFNVDGLELAARVAA